MLVRAGRHLLETPAGGTDLCFTGLAQRRPDSCAPMDTIVMGTLTPSGPDNEHDTPDKAHPSSAKCTQRLATPQKFRSVSETQDRPLKGNGLGEKKDPLS